MLKKLRPLAAVLTLFLAGCYEVAIPVLPSGTYAPVAGLHFCTNHINGQNIEDTLTEKTTGFFVKDYRYYTDEGIEFLFKDIGNNLFFTQIKQQGQPLVVAYMEPTADGMKFLVPNAMAAGAAIEALSRQNAVTARLLQSGRISLTGSQENLAIFLGKNDRSMLLLALTCVKK